MTRRPRALILYHWRGPWPLRSWEAKRLFAWRESGVFDAAYANVAYRLNAADLRAFAPDLIVYDAMAMAVRQIPGARPGLDRATEALDSSTAPRIAAPLDEFLANGELNRLIEQARIDRVYSPAMAGVWSDLYPQAAGQGRVAPMLTSYFDTRLQRMARESSPERHRPIWLGYRTCEASLRFGRAGRLKRDIGVRAAQWSIDNGLVTDVRPTGQDVKRGTSWLRFLQQTRVTVGVEGGSDVLDIDGDLAEAHRTGDPAWSPARPLVEVNLRALSPRHLEAAACGVAQVLVEGDYSGVLQAGRHYLPVTQDLANLEAQLEACRSDQVVRSMAVAAQRELAQNDAFTWRQKMVEIRSDMLS